MRMRTTIFYFTLISSSLLQARAQGPISLAVPNRGQQSISLQPSSLQHDLSVNATTLGSGSGGMSRSLSRRLNQRVSNSATVGFRATALSTASDAASFPPKGVGSYTSATPPVSSFTYSSLTSNTATAGAGGATASVAPFSLSPVHRMTAPPPHSPSGSAGGFSIGTRLGAFAASPSWSVHSIRKNLYRHSTATQPTQSARRSAR